MQKVILLTGATDGIGLETANMLLSQGHKVLLHGRNPQKLAQVEHDFAQRYGVDLVESYVSDLSNIADVEALAVAVAAKHSKLDVLINNAGVYNSSNSITPSGLDIRFVVNALAPYLLTLRLIHLLGYTGRVVNLSSAAQATVSYDALLGKRSLGDGMAYAQSKLAITMWSRELALSLKENGPAIIAVNPASMLGSKMVRDAYGVNGGDLRIGADILCRAALSDEFADASGKYFDNDTGRFASPHPDALNRDKTAKLVKTLDAMLAELVL
jgi:NAD(P)-dependent dehydrogenase (short-subunit alcohol dehydrogenase family)